MKNSLNVTSSSNLIDNTSSSVAPNQENTQPSRASSRPQRLNSHRNDDFQCGLLSCRSTDEDAIECSNCNKWFHSTCSGLSALEFAAVTEEEIIPWFCGTCAEIPLVKCCMFYFQKHARELAMLRNTVESLRAQIQQPLQEPAKVYKQAEEKVYKKETKDTVPATPSYASIVTNKKCELTKNRVDNAHSSKSTIDDLTVICSNLPESSASSLRQREADDRQKWDEICSMIGISASPASLTRLSRHPQSPHQEKPRLLRVVLKSVGDVEKTLLSSALLRETGSDVRIFPDVPWEERQLRRVNPEAAKELRNKRVVIIHGVPELGDQDEATKRNHDCSEWRYIQEILGIEGIITTDVSRIKPPANRNKNGPPLLKITVRSEDMVTSVLNAWYKSKKHAPPELRLRAPYDKTLRKFTPESSKLKPSDELAAVEKNVQ